MQGCEYRIMAQKYLYGPVYELKTVLKYEDAVKIFKQNEDNYYTLHIERINPW